MEPAAVIAPLQSRSRASDGKSQQNVEEGEEESLTASKGEMGLAVSNESP